MLYLIGVGFHPKDMNIAATDAIKDCDRIFAEDYTMRYDFKSLSKILNKDIKILSRADVEESEVIIKDAKKSDVAFLAPGDSLTATTHFSIISAAKERKIPYKIIHNISIFSAIAETGLHIYKFGKTTSIPFPDKGFEPKSFYDVIEKNIRIGAHTLVLLDIGMSVKQGLELLLKASGKKGRLTYDTEIVAAHISDDSRIVYGKIRDVMKTDIPKPSCIVIPAELHFTEKEILEKLYKLA